ncbi:MAG: aldo/keto reductase [Candidatus Poribacteria bacterium]|nr:aldo/keto reductase [Candidatus Poribacteria bacterium]MDE0505518.1 aldo/keto reductase [Candidatus Poribacteria bacterium]
MNTKITGCADALNTRKFADRIRERNPSFEPEAFRQLTGTDLTTSKIGYGSYRVDHRFDEHAATLHEAIQSGCNLIDTSSNYTDGGSETLIGNVLSEQIAGGKIERSEIIVVSKVGYIQGQNLEEAMRREREGESWKEVVKYMDGCWHCIHPDFLVDQWKRSSDRLQLETIDVYLLHNPEYFLSDLHKRSPRANLEEIRDTFYDRIYRAFVQMERFVAEGKVRYYGISSNTFPSPKADFEHVSLRRCYDAACEASKSVHGAQDADHFKVIQLPYNLFEHSALLEVNNTINGQNMTVLEGAESLGIGVLVNRPLNAVQGNQMVRLAQYPYNPDLDYQGAIDREVEVLGETENRLRTTLKDWGIFSQLSESANSTLFFDVAQKLPRFLPQIQNRDHWEQIAQQYIIPLIYNYLGQTIEACPNPNQAEWNDMQQEYVGAIKRLLSLVSGRFNRMASLQAEPISEALDQVLTGEQRKLTLSQKALNFVTSSPGVSVALNGMKRSEYVADAMGLMSVPAFTESVRKLIKAIEE